MLLSLRSELDIFKLDVRRETTGQRNTNGPWNCFSVPSNDLVTGKKFIEVLTGLEESN